jgi:uncharacterized damage-inducible protein DinB
MKHDEDPLRRHLARALGWDEAHLTLEESVKGLPAALRGKKARGFAHSPWELLEHIRLAQSDLLEFCRNGRYVAGKWPEDYWPKSPAPPSPRSWKTSLEAVAADRRAFQQFVESTPDLFAEIPGHPKKTILRSVLLAIDHTSYHVGQLLALRKIVTARL